MERQRPIELEHSDPRPDYREKLLSDLNEHIPEVSISPKAIDLTTTLLDYMWTIYGDPNKDTYLLYHNDEHAYDVLLRAVAITDILVESAPSYVDEHDYELAIIAAAGHDFVQKNPFEDITDEQLSAQQVSKLMRQSGFHKREAKRVYDAIIATTAMHGEDGVEQTHVRQGRRDPLKLIVASADIQATTMEGKMRMLTDVPRLYFETHPLKSSSLTEHIEGMAKFLLEQKRFVGQRLESVHDDLEYYFDEATVIAIEEQYRQKFRSHGRSVLEVIKDVGSATSTVSEILAQHMTELPSSPLKAVKLARQALLDTVASLHNR
jgi:hypothetical protein